MPMQIPFYICWPELIDLGVAALNNDVRIAFLGESVEHGLRKCSLDECLEFC
jgi:hypothetical protein